jgi:hypothetical protein
MLWMVFVLQILPLTLLALASTVVGFAVLSPWVTPAMQLPLGLLALLLFIALLTFRESKGWNLALLLCLALVAGAVMGAAVSPEGRRLWALPLTTSLAALALSGLLGGRLRGRLGKVGIGLWMLSWIYLLGWVILAVQHAPDDLSALWAAIGVVIFIGMATSWFASFGEGVRRPSNTSLAADLYILGFNLTLAIWVISAWISYR